ncbi:MAG TPA: NrfD/PsrC family molybdoenzyme membrane anchor subunit [Gemmatimonadales bacterium]|nr:NrfD/PsrC family molybdoenzyme membrane anchor subunit [Gemmatimonadales bacterium]
MAASGVLRGHADDAQITTMILRPLRTPSRIWWILFSITGLGTLALGCAIWYTVATGIGLWGNNIPVSWAFAIINFVWWIGIGHAGTFISAFLLLLHQKWRASVNRIAEAMTLFALINAGLFPILHLGRPWFFYWLIPYPARMQVWPQFRSSLPWDVAAVTTYFTVSLLFWYLGLVPDLATARDRMPGRLRRRIYGIFSLGWRGAAEQWHHYRIVYLLFAGLATPLVISVHSIVSLDFSITQLPGWHSTIFPPYFVVGAIYSGFAMVLVLLIPVRRIFSLESVITKQHLENMGKLMLAMAMMLAYSYLVESFMAWYSGDPFERYTYLFARPYGPYAGVYWIMLASNLLIPQLLWWKRLRRSPVVLFATGIVVLVGMWLERFIIIVASLNRDFLPSAWHFYKPTWVDLTILFGSVSFFLFLFFLFLRWVPFVSISEVKELRRELAEEAR